MDRATNISWKTTSGATLGGFAYEYDAVGRIVSRSHAMGSNAFDRVYAYDDLDRLASDGGAAYTYDAAGNRTTKTENGATITYTLGAGDRLASWTGGSYTYDVAGCVTRIERDGKPTLDLEWNGQYQLVSVSTNGVFAEGYAYDALGRRVSTTTMDGTTRHVYDSNWQVIADIDEQGNAIVSYTWGAGIDNLLVVKIGGATYYPLTDIQGTVWGYIDSQNNIVARWQYDAWGNVVDEEIASTATALASLRYRFQGRECSAATGLINFRMRWYDPETGRWLSKDPIGLSGGLNLYEFCGECPLIFVDPLGRSFWPKVIDACGRFNRYAHPELLNFWVWHHYAREYLNTPLPEVPPDETHKEWRRLSRKESVFHDNGDEYEECKYVHRDGREVVYDGRTRAIITDSVYKGTYNFVNPGTLSDAWFEYAVRFVGHGLYDVLPYLIMGN